MNRISLQDAINQKMFGPVYHGATSDKTDIIDKEGFKVFIGSQEIGDRSISNGYSRKITGHYSVYPPVHHLGFGVYFTTNKSIAKRFSFGNTNIGPYFLDIPRMATINWGSPNTMMKWWMDNGYDPKMAQESEIGRIQSTKLMTAHLRERWDGIWYKGKGIFKLLDGDQVVVFDPSRIYKIDPSLSKPGEIGSRVRAKVGIDPYNKGVIKVPIGTRGTIISVQDTSQQIKDYPDAKNWIGDSKKIYEIKFDKGGTIWGVLDTWIELLPTKLKENIDLNETLDDNKFIKSTLRKEKISPQLVPLIKLAKYYSTFQEFERDYSGNNFHGFYWHLTNNPNFQINPEYAPRDLSSMAASGTGTPGLMVTTDIGNWDANFKKNRQYAALIDLSDLIPNRDYRNVARGFGHEIFVFRPQNAKVVSVYSISDAKRLNYRHYKYILPQNSEQLETIYNLAHKKENLLENDEPKNPRLGKCYELAGRYVLHHQSAILVHGKLKNPFFDNTKYLPYVEHAWVEENGKIFDLIPDRWWDKDIFNTIYQPKIYKTYNSHEVSANILKYNHWGPWNKQNPPKPFKEGEDLNETNTHLSSLSLYNKVGQDDLELQGITEARLKWNKDPDDQFYTSIDGKYSLNPVYIGRTIPQKWEVINNITKERKMCPTLKDAKEKADMMEDPNFRPKVKNYIAKGTKEEIQKIMQKNYDYFISQGKLAYAEVVRKNAEAAGIKLIEKNITENDDDHGDALQSTGYWGRQGAGAIVLSLKTGRILLPKRSGGVEQPHTWGVWGGAIDTDENPQNAVKREIAEELGYNLPMRLIPMYVYKDKDFVYYNFLAIVENEFEPKLNWETESYRWIRFGDWPHPLHFGLQALLQHSGRKIEKIVKSIYRKNNIIIKNTSLKADIEKYKHAIEIIKQVWYFMRKDNFTNNLDKFDDYEFRMYALNDHGLSDKLELLGKRYYPHSQEPGYEFLDYILLVLEKLEQAHNKRLLKKIDTTDPLFLLKDAVKNTTWEQAKSNLNKLFLSYSVYSGQPIDDDKAESFFNRLYLRAMGETYYNKENMGKTIRLSDVRSGEGPDFYSNNIFIRHHLPAKSKGFPEHVRVFRGTNAPNSKIQPGDFVSLDRDYVRGYMRGKFGSVVSEILPSKDLWIHSMEPDSSQMIYWPEGHTIQKYQGEVPTFKSFWEKYR
jgi:8-oxo-dGTP pyrophosphatase MutT (NUDIX family)